MPLRISICDKNSRDRFFPIFGVNFGEQPKSRNTLVGINVSSFSIKHQYFAVLSKIFTTLSIGSVLVSVAGLVVSSVPEMQVKNDVQKECVGWDFRKSTRSLSRTPLPNASHSHTPTPDHGRIRKQHATRLHRIRVSRMVHTRISTPTIRVSS